jgi:hypothetical protein
LPSTLAGIRVYLQTLLDDLSADIWTTGELDVHIKAALKDLSHHIPLEAKNTVATSSGSRDVDISALTNRVRVVAVEYPVDQWPRVYVRFSLWLDVLTVLDDPIPDGSNCYVYWHTHHTINGTDTLPEDHEETLVFGAAARACEQQQADATNTLATGGPASVRDWAALAASHRQKYEARLHPRRGLRQTRFYRPDRPIATQDSDPGP